MYIPSLKVATLSAAVFDDMPYQRRGHFLQKDQIIGRHPLQVSVMMLTRSKKELNLWNLVIPRLLDTQHSMDGSFQGHRENQE